MVPCAPPPVNSVSKPTTLWRGNVCDTVVSPPRTYQCFFTVEQSGFSTSFISNIFPRYDVRAHKHGVLSPTLWRVSSVPESTFPTFQYFWYRLSHTMNGHRGLLISTSLIWGCIFPLLAVHKWWSSNKYSFGSVWLCSTQSTWWGWVRADTQDASCLTPSAQLISTTGIGRESK